MDAVTNITTAASRVIWGDAGADTAHNETAGKEPVSGQLGDVSAGEPYDKGNAETPTTEYPPTLATAGSKVAPIGHDNNAVAGPTSLYNPILPATPGERSFSNDASSSAEAASEVSRDSRSAAQKSQKSQIEQSAAETQARESAVPQVSSTLVVAGTNGVKDKSRDENVKHSGLTAGVENEKEKATKGLRRTVSGDRARAAHASVSKEAERLSAYKRAITPPGASRTAAGAVDSDVEETFRKIRKPSLREKIKAKLHKQ